MNGSLRGNVWLCDLACRTLTGRQLPDLCMKIIQSDSFKKVPKRTPPRPKSVNANCVDFEIIEKSAHKKKWTKKLMSKFRIKQAFRYR